MKGCGTSLFFALLVGLCLSLPAEAVVNVGGMNFDDNAFADTVIDTSLGSAGNILGSDVNTAVSFDDDYVKVGFTDNVIVNGPGADVAVFTQGLGDRVDVALDVDEFRNPIGPSVTVTPTDTGTTNGSSQPVGVVQVDLTALGVPAGATLSRIVVGDFVSNDLPDLVAVGALNSRASGTLGAPLASGLGLVVLTFALCLVGGAAFRRR